MFKEMTNTIRSLKVRYRVMLSAQSSISYLLLRTISSMFWYGNVSVGLIIIQSLTFLAQNNINPRGRQGIWVSSDLNK